MNRRVKYCTMVYVMYSCMLNASLYNEKEGILMPLYKNSASINNYYSVSTGNQVYLNRLLFESCRHNDTSMVKQLCQQAADPNTKDIIIHDLFCVDLAIKNNNLPMVETLVEAGATLNRLDVLLYTPLHRACCNKQAVIIRYLIGHNANVNSINYLGETPLYMALREHHYKAIPLLLWAGADIHQKTKNKDTPWLYTKRSLTALVKQLKPLVSHFFSGDRLREAISYRSTSGTIIGITGIALLLNIYYDVPSYL